MKFKEGQTVRYFSTLDGGVVRATIILVKRDGRWRYVIE